MCWISLWYLMKGDYYMHFDSSFDPEKTPGIGQLILVSMNTSEDLLREHDGYLQTWMDYHAFIVLYTQNL